MRLYIKGDYTKKINFGVEELVGKMWFSERNGCKVSYSHSGNDEWLQEDFSLGLRLSKWETNNSRWDSLELPSVNNPWKRLDYEAIKMDFEDTYVSDYRERGDCLRIITTHQDILTVDKRAAYIMAIEVATAIDGHISTDDKKSWLTVDEFKAEHSEILSLTYEEATDISLEEILTMEAVFEPLQDELDEAREEYIKIHGERVWEDEDEETFGF